MISSAMNTKLNEQVTAEFAASHKYLSMACAFERMGLKNLKARFLKQFQEETGHAMKILRFVEEVGGTVAVDAVPKPQGDFQSALAIAEAAVASEVAITKRIHDIVALAINEKDYTTQSFMQWFVNEQVEEISTMTDIQTWVRLAGQNLLQADSMVRHSMEASRP